MRTLSFVPRLFFALPIALSGCGHPATEEECEKIVERITVLELGDAAADGVVAEEVRNAKESFKKEIQRKCVGRRITDKAMQCVRSATRARQIEDECFR